MEGGAERQGRAERRARWRKSRRREATVEQLRAAAEALRPVATSGELDPEDVLVDLGVASVRGPRTAPKRAPTLESCEKEMETAMWMAAQSSSSEGEATSGLATQVGTYGVKVNLQEKLRARKQLWEVNGAVPVVLRWIAEGYDCAWAEAGPPEAWRCKGNHKALEDVSAPLNMATTQTRSPPK